MKSLKFVALVLLCVVPLVVLSCSNKSVPTYTLKDSTADVDAERARLRQMQMVRVIKQTDDPNDPENGTSREWSDETFYQAIGLSCPEATTQPTPCLSMLEHAKGWYCRGELLLAIAGGAQDVVLVNNDVGVKYKVPPQSAATAASVATGAASYFSVAMQRITPIFSGQDIVGDGICSFSSTNIVHREQAGQATSLFIDSYQKAKKAHELASTNILSVADAQLASTANFQTGAARSMAGPELSRAALAHLLVGGAPGIAGSTSKAMCSGGRLSGPEKRALDIVREAGISPADVLNSESGLSTSRLLNGEGPTGLANGTVRQRLEDVWGTTFPDGQSVEQFYGLKLADFQAARGYLQDEIQAFSRSKTAQLAKRRFGGGRMETYARFAGLTASPTELPDAYWMAVALTEGPVPGTIVGGDTEQRDDGWALARSPSAAVLPGDFSHSFAGLTDYARSWAAAAAARSTFQSFTTELVNPL